MVLTLKDHPKDHVSDKEQEGRGKRAPLLRDTQSAVAMQSGEPPFWSPLQVGREHSHERLTRELPQVQEEDLIFHEAMDYLSSFEQEGFAPLRSPTYPPEELSIDADVSSGRTDWPSADVEGVHSSLSSEWRRSDSSIHLAPPAWIVASPSGEILEGPEPSDDQAPGVDALLAINSVLQGLALSDEVTTQLHIKGVRYVSHSFDEKWVFARVTRGSGRRSRSKQEARLFYEQRERSEEGR